MLGEHTDGSLVPLTWWYQQNNLHKLPERCKLEGVIEA